MLNKSKEFKSDKMFENLVSNYNEAVNKSMFSKYFNDNDDIEWLIDELNPHFYPDSAVKDLVVILDKVTNNGSHKLKVEDEEFSGTIHGTEIDIKGNNNNYISGEYKVGELVLGFGSPSQTAILTRFKI